MGAAAAVPAVPASAAAPPAGHTLISFPQRDFVSDQGFKQSDGPVIVEVIRNGATIATSTPVVPQDDPKTSAFDGLVEVNHPGGGCWQNTTPDILPGDTIRMTAKNGTGFSEETTTANVTAQPAELDAVTGDVVVHGTAQDTAGNPLPVDQIEQRIVANKQQFELNGRRTLRASAAGADGTLTYDPVDAASNPHGINWTATYPGLTDADKTLATTNETRGMWLGANPAATNEATIYETSLDGSIVPGPATPDCTAPFRPNAIGAVRMNGAPLSVINSANVNGMIAVSGAYDPDNVSAVALTVGGAPVPVTLASTTWTAEVPAAALPEGTVDLTASFTATATGGGAPDNTMSIVKDTVAPPAPKANLATGTYKGAQTIILSAVPGATIRFTADGTTPTATSGLLFAAPFSVTSTQTVTAVAVDDHGNASAPNAFSYTIEGAPGVLPAIGFIPAAPVQVLAPAKLPPLAQVLGTRTTSPLAVSRLTLARRISVARVRLQGLRASMQVKEGTNVVRIAVYKARNGRKAGSAVYVTSRAVRPGLLRVTLRSRGLLARLRTGTYVMEVRSGQSLGSLGATRRIAFTVTP